MLTECLEIKLKCTTRNNYIVRFSLAKKVTLLLRVETVEVKAFLN